MSNFVGKSPFSSSLWVAMETKHFHKAHTICFKDNFVSHLGGPNEQFGTHEKLSWGRGCKVTSFGCRGKSFTHFRVTRENMEHCIFIVFFFFFGGGVGVQKHPCR